ncbi:unnamed protein product [Porites evermanni]|uniref:EGF-like domain-containing protein n=1 Tax=Porites evermanni TaxID=104178 RepID=A0ABN8M4T7_9CNID|nr:unnamed protein product [Porites evermanni]
MDYAKMAIFILLAFSCLSYTDGGCLPQDCQVSSWTYWSSCYGERCGGRGVQRRTRWKDIVPSCGGSECPTLEETRSCGSELTSCLNGGRLNDDGTCSCANGYSGQCCEVKPDGGGSRVSVTVIVGGASGGCIGTIIFFCIICYCCCK